MGFVGIADPVPRRGVSGGKKTQEAGIKVIMITGDNLLTAEAIGIETGIIKGGRRYHDRTQLDDYSDEELMPILAKVKSLPVLHSEHKYDLVKLLQRLGEIVAVTGDGVNDALSTQTG